MNSNVVWLRLCDYLPPLRRLGLFVAAVAVAAMSIVAVAANVSQSAGNGHGTRPVVVANDRNNPATTPAVPSAGAQVIAPAWQGGGWQGGGPFHGGGWPGQ